MLSSAFYSSANFAVSEFLFAVLSFLFADSGVMVEDTVVGVFENSVFSSLFWGLVV